MRKTVSVLTQFIIIVLFIYIWTVVQQNADSIDKTYIYIYLTLVVCSLLSDRYFYRGQKSENKKEHEMTSHFIAYTWFAALAVPVLEHVYATRYNSILTIIGTVSVVFGILVRGIGIKTLGRFFSRDVETWSNQKIIETGIYRYIRHPAYAGNILQVIGFPFVLNAYYSLILSLITIIGFMWRIKVEERFLIKELQGYEEYMKRTKKLIPKIW